MMEVVGTSETSVYFNEPTRLFFFQKDVIFILFAVRTSNLTGLILFITS
jgi:hypothetical protein